MVVQGQEFVQLHMKHFGSWKTRMEPQKCLHVIGASAEKNQALHCLQGAISTSLGGRMLLIYGIDPNIFMLM